MFAKVSLFTALLAVGVNAQALLINTPTALITCQPYALTWSGGEAPYYVSVIPGGNQQAAALETIGDQPTTATTFPWTVDIASGTSITMKVTDSQGNSAFSAPVTILAGGSTACIGQNSVSSGATSAAQTASGSAASSAASSASAATSSSAATRPASSVSSAASSAASSVSSAASSAVSSVSTAVSASSSTSSSPSSSSAPPTSATGSAPAQSSAPASGANKVAFSGLALFGAAALAIAA